MLAALNRTTLAPLGVWVAVGELGPLLSCAEVGGALDDELEENKEGTLKLLAAGADTDEADVGEAPLDAETVLPLLLVD